jgi:hypothetical protein
MGSASNKPENLKKWEPFKNRLESLGFERVSDVVESTAFYVGYQKKITNNFILVVWTNLYFARFNVRAEITALIASFENTSALQRMTLKGNSAATFKNFTTVAPALNDRIPELERLIVDRSVANKDFAEVHPEITKVIFQSAKGSIVSAKSLIGGISDRASTQVAKYIKGVKLMELDDAIKSSFLATECCSLL